MSYKNIKVIAPIKSSYHTIIPTKINIKQFFEDEKKINENVPAQLNRTDIFPSKTLDNQTVINSWQISMTSEGLFSVTPWQSNETMVEELIKYMGHYNLKNVKFFDGTANCGADVIGTLWNLKSRLNMEITAVELDRLNFKCLKENVELFKAEKYVNVIEGDSLDIIKNSPYNESHVIYWDPPWGGVNYKEEKELVLKLNSKDVFELAESMLNDNETFSNLRLVIIKIPLKNLKERIETMGNNVKLIYSAASSKYNIGYVFMLNHDTSSSNSSIVSSDSVVKSL